LQVGYLCNNAHIQDGSLFGQPTEGALIAVALKVTICNETYWFMLQHALSSYGAHRKFGE